MQDNGGREPFDICFNFINFHNEQAAFDGLAVENFFGHDKYHYKLTLVVSTTRPPERSGLELRVEYHRGCFAEADVGAILANFRAEAERIAGAAGSAS